ncbi:MAG: hypothetical protein U0795_24290 [Pirellulales bacterium]
MDVTDRFKAGKRQFRLRTLIAIGTVLAIGLGILAKSAKRANDKAVAASALTSMGSTVWWDVDLRARTHSPLILWLAKSCGKQYFSDVTNASLVDATDEHLKHIAVLGGITRLTIKARRVTPEGIREIRRLTKLKSLVLMGPGIGDGELAELPEFPRLDHLELHGTDVAGPGFENLRRQPRLREIYLDDPDFNDDCIQYLTGLSQVTWIVFQGSSVSQQGAEQLFASHPDRTVCVGSSSAGNTSDTFYYFTFTPRDGYQWLRDPSDVQ